MTPQIKVGPGCPFLRELLSFRKPRFASSLSAYTKSRTAANRREPCPTLKILLPLLLCGGLLAGCDAPHRDNAEESNPQVAEGLAFAHLKQWDRAIKQFEGALANNAELARPDLELALIYQQQQKNFVRAVYHYERYLEKRPDSQKRPLIIDWIRQAKISLAAEIGKSSGDISEELIRLTRENNLLRKQLSRTAATAPSVTSVRTVLNDPPPKREPEPEPEPPVITPKPTPVSAEPIPRFRTPAPTPETYKVLPGDTLSKIARTIFGDSSKWKEIYGANMNKMQNENDIKAGQTITIPLLKNPDPAIDPQKPRG